MENNGESHGKALSAIDTANSADPNRVLVEGKEEAKELAYARRMTAWLFRIEEHPSEILQLAARAQHICRWEIGRKSYPAGRIGYLQWRTALYSYHAQRAGEILRADVGYESAIIERVQRLLCKQGIKTDADMQMLEDVICLVFLEYELEDFAQQHPAEKVIVILRKTWRKMSPRCHAAAVQLSSSLSQSDSATSQIRVTINSSNSIFPPDPLFSGHGPYSPIHRDSLFQSQARLGFVEGDCSAL